MDARRPGGMLGGTIEEYVRRRTGLVRMRYIAKKGGLWRYVCIGVGKQKVARGYVGMYSACVLACVSSGIHGSSTMQRNITFASCYHLGRETAADIETVYSLITYFTRREL